MGCMKHIMRHIRWVGVGLSALLLVVGCSVVDFEVDIPSAYEYPDNGSSGEGDLAIGTLRSKDGVRYIKLDENTCSHVVNPGSVADIPDGTRVFLEFRYIVYGAVAAFCTDAILVEWASQIDAGDVHFLDFEESFSIEAVQSAKYTDPMDIVTDWMTSLEDGFLTLHYSIPKSGDKGHRFSLYRSMGNRNLFYLVHNAEGDTIGTLSDGIICFDVSPLLPETGDETVKLSFVYIDLNNTEKRLTFDYRSSK